MNTIDNQEQTTLAPLGKALQAARLAASLSIEAAAEKLNLGVSTLRDIEDDLDNTIVNQKYAVIYLRGYLTNYAKLVRLEKLNQFSEYQQLAESEKRSANLRAPMILPPPAKKRSKLLLFICMLLGTGLYLLLAQQDFSGTPSPLHADKTEAEINSGSSLSDTEVVRGELPLFESESEYVDSGTETAVDEASSDSEQMSIHAEPLVLDAVQQTDAAEVAVADSQVANAALPSADVSAESAEPVVQKNVAVTESLQLSFSANCWTEIFDATGKRLAFDLYKAGSSLTVAGVAPFELKLGEPSGVKIEYQGKIISREFALGHTARFTIPQ